MNLKNLVSIKLSISGQSLIRLKSLSKLIKMEATDIQSGRSQVEDVVKSSFDFAYTYTYTISFITAKPFNPNW